MKVTARLGWGGNLLLEQRNSSVAEVHDSNETVGRHGDPAGPVQLPRSGTVGSKLLHKNSRGGENLKVRMLLLILVVRHETNVLRVETDLNSVIPGIRHYDISFIINSHTVGSRELPVLGSLTSQELRVKSTGERKCLVLK